MASAIGLRGYLVTAHKKGDRARLPFNSSEFNITPPQFFTNFVKNHAVAVQNEEKERSWYFAEREKDSLGNSKGYTHYGTFGFESNFVDSKTKTQNYRRKVNDIEEIPLFYEIWFPEKKDFFFAAFQSFQGRSCIGLIMDQAQQEFTAINPGYVLKYQKLLPSESNSLYDKEPVRSLRLIKRNAPQDVTDRYLGREAPDEVNFEVRLSARRSKILGLFGEVTGALKTSDAGLVLHDGIEFSEAYADVKIGGKYRPVGVFGSDSNAGVIDITEDVIRGSDGHPTYQSLCEQSDKILLDFFDTLDKTKS
ncbi:hypothetical protein [Gluconobacter sp. DsW_058]|uniref:hypothetical protein n=1 Tax=Gluconobacter sp. DsW_058 TaxID=1511210 RepID=UPI000A38EB53|nr:hypothetical protein [Gluconobacter sp. DsW_058]OUJ09284.1 hypothetical protein HK24_00535 [Gluconobacter sp. DsW_058]